jgi:hypothetical protein
MYSTHTRTQPPPLTVANDNPQDKHRDEERVAQVKREIVVILERQEGGRMVLADFSVVLYRQYGGKEVVLH